MCLSLILCNSRFLPPTSMKADLCRLPQSASLMSIVSDTHFNQWSHRNFTFPIRNALLARRVTWPRTRAAARRWLANLTNSIVDQHNRPRMNAWNRQSKSRGTPSPIHLVQMGFACNATAGIIRWRPYLTRIRVSWGTYRTRASLNAKKQVMDTDDIGYKG